MSRDYRSYDPTDAAEWYAHDEGILELQQERARELAEERTENDVKELANSGKVTLADRKEYTLYNLLDIADGDFFACYMMKDNINKYYAEKNGEKFMTEMMQAAAEKCSDVIYDINYEAL